MSKHWHLLLWLALVPVLIWIGHGLLFTAFMLYDDEGYVLLTLRNQIEHGGLYEKVYSQYGPFFYALLGGLSRLLDFEWNNTSGRWFTLFTWMTASGLCGLIVWRARRLWPATLVTTVSVFALLWIMIQEPVHPGGLIVLLVALAALVGAEFIRAGATHRFAIVLGATGACVGLVKINAGAFLLISGGLWLLTAQAGRLRNPALSISLLVSCMLPFILMRPLLDQTWVPTFALMAALAALSSTLVASQCNQRRATPAHLVWYAGAALIATLLVATWGLAQGTSLAQQFRGIILEPLRHPGIYSFGVPWRPAVIPVASIALGLTLAWVLRPKSSHLLHIIAGIRVLAVLGIAAALFPGFRSSQAMLALCYGVPLAGLFALPLRNSENQTGAQVRVWLALVLVFQSLQAFPIAGSQLNWGTFLWIPLLVLGAIDALEFWSETCRPNYRKAGCFATAALACVLAAVQIKELTGSVRNRTGNGVHLGLRGAETLFLPAQVASAMHIMATNARLHSDMLFSLPGTFSLNNWSGRPAPTLRNVTHWFSLLSEQEQQEIIDAMSAEPRAVFVLQRHLIFHLTDRGFPVRGPLVTYLRNHYHESFAVDGYSFWVRKGREISPYSLASWEETSSGQHRVGINLPPFSEPVARLEAGCYDEAGQSRPSTHSALGEEAFTPLIQSIDEQGNPAGPLFPVVWPIPPGGARRLTFNFSIPRGVLQERPWVFRMVAADGRTLGFARFSSRR